MNHLAELQRFLPDPYTLARDGVLTRLLDVVALELECVDEDLDRLRQTHWIRTAYRLEDVEKLAALVGVARLPWEDLRTFRARLLPLVKARLAGALGPEEIKRFVYEYLQESERALTVTAGRGAYQLVPGLQRVTLDEAYAPPPDRPLFRPLALEENPHRTKRSGVLAARGGNVPYLYRWTEANRGLEPTVATFAVTGLFGGVTTVPVLVNVTTGDLLGFSRPLKFGQRLDIEPAGEGDRAHATLNGVDVTEHLFGMRGFALGTPFALADLDPEPRLPRLARGPNDWIYLSVGLFDVKGLNRFFFAIARDSLYEGKFDETFFDRALFPSGNVCRLEMQWIETEPASFVVRVPRYVVIEPRDAAAAEETPPYEEVAAGLRDAIGQLRAAGVRAAVELVPFVETQRQRVRVTLPWVVTDREIGSAGARDRISIGGRFGETSLGDSRYE